jgi:hypothetical protein
MARSCGECTLCCKLMPVPEMVDKVAGVRCPHQRSHKGCSIYPKRPLSCQFWSCAWLSWDDTADLSRPDRAHYVIDIMPDFVTVQDDHKPHRPQTQVPVIQVWLDPKYPDAHRDPALRALINSRSQKDGCAAIIRFGSEDALILFPPAISEDGQWHERRSNMRVDQHTFAEIMTAIQKR